MHNLQTKFKDHKLLVMESEALETQSSMHAVASCEVKSRFFKHWSNREISVSLEDRLLTIVCPDTGKKKEYPLDEVSYTRNLGVGTTKLRVSPHRSYEVRTNMLLEQSLKDIDYYHTFKIIEHANYEPQIPSHRTISYQPTTQKPNIFLEKTPQPKQPTISIPVSIIQKKQIPKPVHEYERQNSYIKLSDWKRDTKNGGLIFINKEKKHLIPEMISYTAKKVVSSGSFTNINFPTFAMKPESTLETYCKCLGAAPLLLSNVGQSPVQRMKAFNAIILSMSIQFNDIEKSFNPLLGETFQGYIGGLLVYAEQICHKPSVSSFLLVGPNYRLYGNLELKADIGFNEAVGYFNGEVTLEFDDGNKITGIMPKGIMSGVLFGQTKFGPTGAVYCYDMANKLVCSYETRKGDTMTGQIGKLKHGSIKKFQKNLQEKSHQNIRHLSEGDFQILSSKMEVIYTDSISYDGKLYFSYSNKNNLPIKMVKNGGKADKLLQSDSSFRADIQQRKENKIKQSQKSNDEIEYEQERLRRLRKPK